MAAYGVVQGQISAYEKTADAEVEAVAKKLLWWDTAPVWEDVMPSEDCFWTLAEPEMRANYLRDAREMLEIARKEVSE